MAFMWWVGNTLRLAPYVLALAGWFVVRCAADAEIVQ